MRAPESLVGLIGNSGYVNGQEGKASITIVHLNGPIPKGEGSRGKALTQNHKHQVCAEKHYLQAGLLSGGLTRSAAGKKSALHRPPLKRRCIINAKYQAQSQMITIACGNQ